MSEESNRSDAVAGISEPVRYPAPMGARLSPPGPFRYEIERAQISDEIFAAGGASLVLICAPAGFGKTTVMRQVHERCQKSGVGSAWLNLDPSDNDISRLLTGLVAALDDVMPGISREVSLEAFTLGAQTAVLLLERISRHGEPFVLFLDDFEVIESSPVSSLVRQLIHALPAGSQVIIGTRVIPDLGLARLRALGRLLEIEPAQLRFTLDEAGDFLRSGRRLQLSPTEVGQLHFRTEGWIAGLWLASLALADREGAAHPAGEQANFIALFSGSNAAIADYLTDDVLSQQAPELKAFLLRTSILNAMNAEVCNAILGRHDSQRVLEELERTNLFVVPLDSHRGAYRYHGLFLQFLRGQLKRDWPAEVQRLHRAAAEWYLSQSRPVPAIEHAMLSGDLDFALPLLESHAMRLLGDARMRILARWLGSVPASSLRDHPVLQIVYAWAINFTSGPHEALALLEQLDDGQGLEAEPLAYLLALKLLLLLRTDRIEEAYETGVRRFSGFPILGGFVRSMYANALGTASMMLGKFSEAQRFLDEARRVQAPTGGTFAVVLSESVEGAMDLLRGNLTQAIARLRGAVEPRDDGPKRYAKANALAGVLLAEALYEIDERVESERLLRGHLPMIQEGGLPDQLISGHVLLARLAALKGDNEQAFQTIMELEYLGGRLQLPRVSASARLERANLALRMGRTGSAGDELKLAAESLVWSAAATQFMVANDAETFEVMEARWMCRSDRAQAALERLKRLVDLAEAERRVRRTLKLRILLAEALSLCGQASQGLQEIIKALRLGHQGSYVRTFADEGDTILKLVQEVLASAQGKAAGVPNEYLERILAAGGVTPRADSVRTAGIAVEPLTRKEITVLRHAAEGLSNRELAQKLFLSETTIRTHLRNINAKLGVHSRVRAIIVGRSQGYID